MGLFSQTKLTGRVRRKFRIRKKISGNAVRPRLSVFRSTSHIYAQVVDDDQGTTLVAASTRDKALRASIEGKKVDRAKQVGIALAQRCKEKGIAQVVFDRNGFQYHGRIKAVADGAREGGLNF